MDPQTAQQITTTAAGVTFAAWTNGHAVGYRVTRPDGRTEYLYLVPSESVENGSADAFLYHGITGDTDQDAPRHYYSLFADPEPRSTARAAFLTDMITTAVEGGISYWATVGEYRWYSPTLDGGSAQPGPDNIANAHVTVYDLPHDGRAFTIGLDETEHALERITAGPVKGMSESRRACIRRAYEVNDHSETGLDSDDADEVFQVACFGRVIYG